MTEIALTAQGLTPEPGRAAAVPEIALREASPTDDRVLADLFAAAFLDDPVIGWAFPDRDRRRELLPHIFATFIDAYRGLGETYIADDGIAGVIAAPPGGEPDEERFSRIFEVTREYAARTARLNEAIEIGQPSEPHYYLLLAAVRPGSQSRGIGSAVLGRLLERCDRDGVPAYLDATAARNRDLYLRHGFEVTERAELPGGTPFWRMWREPR